MTKFKTKDSGERKEFKSGMKRDTDKDKPRYDLIIPLSQKHEDTMLYRLAMLMARGAVKYGDRNWEKASSDEELQRFKQSALRHMFQAMTGEEDEDHFAATIFNLIGYEYVKQKLS